MSTVVQENRRTGVMLHRSTTFHTQGGSLGAGLGSAWRDRTWKVTNVIDAFDRYQRGYGCGDNTLRRRRAALTSFVAFLAPAGLEDATSEHVEDWLATKGTPRTRHAYRSDLNVFYEWAVKRHQFTSNPVTDTRSVRTPKGLPRPVGAEVYAALNTGRQRTRLMVALGLFAGLRCAEIAALDCADIDMNHQVIFVRSGKGGKDRTVDIHPYLAGLLQGLPSSGPVFRWKGKAVRPQSVSQTIRRQFERCHIDATPHQLRHRFGTEMTRASKGDLVTVAAKMGHDSMDTTMGYVGWSGNAREIVDRMFSDLPDSAA